MVVQGREQLTAENQHRQLWEADAEPEAEEQERKNLEGRQVGEKAALEEETLETKVWMCERT